MRWINRFVSDRNRTFIANKFAKLGVKSSRSPLTGRCTFVPDAGALFNRFTAPIIDESDLNIFVKDCTNHPSILAIKEIELWL